MADFEGMLAGLGFGVLIALLIFLIMEIADCLVGAITSGTGLKLQFSRLFRIKHSIKELKTCNPKMPAIIADIKKRRDEGFIKSLELLDFGFTRTLNVDPERNWCYYPYNNKIIWYGGYGEGVQEFKLSEKLKFQLACVVYGLDKE